MTYRVVLEQFEGPLGLLLHLIEEEQLDVTRVSLAKVADQYLAYMRQQEALTLEHLAEFLAVAARLILLKSRALLPLLTFTDEEEAAIEDLEGRLREYKRMQGAALVLGSRWEHTGQAAVRESFLGEPITFAPPRDLSVSDVRQAFERVLGEITLPKVLETETLPDIVTLEQKIKHLQVTLQERLETSFASLTRDVEHQAEIIVTFLAVLELVKQRWISVEQSQAFSDIRVRRITLMSEAL